MPRPMIAIVLTVVLSALVLAQTEKLDYATIGRIRDEGLNRSQVMDHISWLSDVYGPRLTGIAGHSAGERLGDEEVRRVGPGQRPPGALRSSARAGRSCASTRSMLEPQVQPLIGFPQEWSPGTKGTVTADVVRVQIASEADFAKYRGKLAGKIVLTQPARAGPAARRADRPADGRQGHRGSRDDAGARRRGRRRTGRRGGGDGVGSRRGGVPRSKVDRVPTQPEGVVAMFDRGSDSDMAAGGSDLSWQQQRPDGGTIFPSGSRRARRQRRHRACRA